ncbi:cobalamin B12-binding domain-containing protein [archaeon]|nr:cobalamin B12-binding domain-containing protein [archaeon]
MKISLISAPLREDRKKAERSLVNRLSTLFDFITKGRSEVKSCWPPLGILYLGTVLKENGYEVSLLDAEVQELKYEEVLEWVKKEDPDVLGFTCFTPNFIHTANIAKEVRKQFPHIKIVFGGPQVTFAPNETLRNYKFVDVVVRGEAEETILELLEVFKGRKKLKKVDGISFRNNGEIVHTPQRKADTDLDKIPFPDRTLLPEVYDNQMGGISFSTGKYAITLSSRGCPFSCTFCSATAFRNRVCTFRSPENFVDELEFLASCGYRDIGIVDDSFTLISKRVEKICDLIIKRKLDFNWLCESRVDQSSYETFKKMKKAGCEIVYLGIESANQRILDYYNKKITPQQSMDSVKAAKRAGLDVVGSFIVGAPIETKGEIINTVKFIKKLPLTVPQVNPLEVRSPGIALWDILTAQNPSLKKYWNTGFNPVKLGMCEYSWEWLAEMIGKAYIQFIFNTDFIFKETIKSFTDPFRLELIRTMTYSTVH